MIRQISVFLENRSGQLAEITAALSDANIDLRAIHIAETAHYGVLRMIATNTAEALDTLAAKGFVITSTPVVAVSIKDHPGSLNRILRMIADRGMDIEYMYSIFSQVAGTAHMIFRVADSEALEKLLEEADIHVASESELGI